MDVKIVKLKRIETQKDLIDLNTPAKVLMLIRHDGGKTIEIVFDTDDDKDIEDSMKIIEKYMPKYKKLSTRKEDKEKFIKKLKGEE